MVDYTYYTGTYKGTAIPSSDFDRLITRAGSYLTSAVTDLDPTTDNAKMAACAVAEAWQTNERGGDLASQSVGAWSKSFQQKAAKSDQERLYEAAQLYLGGLVRKVRWC